MSEQASRLPPGVPAEEYPFEGHFLDVGGGVRLHYLDEGAGEPIVLVHGNPSWSFYWRRLVLALRGRYRVIVPDHVGCGLSDKPGDDRYTYTLDRRIQDLAALLAHLGLDRSDAPRVTLGVHDWGGAIGFGWAVDHPERVGRLVVFNTAAFQYPTTKALPGALRLVRDTGLGAFLVQRMNAFARGAAFIGCTRRRMSPALRRAYCAPYDTPTNRIATLRFVQDIPLGPGDPAWDRGNHVEAHLGALAGVPMILCWGERDFVFDGRFRAKWEQLFPGAEVHRFDDAGHYVVEDAFDDILPRVTAFLERHPLAPA